MVVPAQTKARRATTPTGRNCACGVHALCCRERGVDCIRQFPKQCAACRTRCIAGASTGSRNARASEAGSGHHRTASNRNRALGAGPRARCGWGNS